MLLLGLAPGGGRLAAALLRTPVVSYTAFSPSPREGQSVSVARSGRLPRPALSAAPRPMECGLSSTTPARGRGRPTGLGVSIIPAARRFVNRRAFPNFHMQIL